MVGAEGRITQVFQTRSGRKSRPSAHWRRGQFCGGKQRVLPAAYEEVYRPADGADCFRDDLSLSHEGTPSACASPHGWHEGSYYRVARPSASKCQLRLPPYFVNPLRSRCVKENRRGPTSYAPADTSG